MDVNSIECKAIHGYGIPGAFIWSSSNPLEMIVMCLAPKVLHNAHRHVN